MRTVTREQMRKIELASFEYGMTHHRLMENAGSAAAAFIRRTFRVDSLNCMIFCGSGNNGGDGLVVARRLFEHNANVVIVLVGAPPSSMESAAMLEMASLMNLPMVQFEQQEKKVMDFLKQTDIIVDAIFGTGFRGELPPRERKACDAINDAIAAVISLDVPSGVECDSGMAQDGAVVADFTVAFDSLKPLHTMAPSLAYCGKVELVDIGIPSEARNSIASTPTTLSTPYALSLLPQKDPQSHKGNYGRLLCICGSAQYPGAASLAAMAALRCGVGLVSVASVPLVCITCASKLHEATYLTLAENSFGTIDIGSAQQRLPSKLRGSTAVLLGCGLGNNDHTQQLLKLVVRQANCPIIIDADGINALSENIDILQEAKVPIVLTPHLGEMSRLTGLPIQEIEADRMGVAAQWAQRLGATIVLKSHQTVIASPEKQLFVSSCGNAGLAKGGSGDVLAGMISALVAQGIEATAAACCAVHLHGQAADNTAQRLSQYAMLPSDLLDDLAQIFAANHR